MKAKHILIFATIFILSMGLGLFGPIAYENIKEWIEEILPPGNGGKGGKNPPPVPDPPKKELLVSLQKKSSKPRLVVTNVDYSYTYEAKVTPTGIYKYTLSDVYGNTYTSNDGKFTGVAANADGVYNLVIFSPEQNAQSEPITIKGFITKTKIPKLTVGEVNTAVKTGNFSKVKRKMASGCKILKSGTSTTLQNESINVNLGIPSTCTSIKYNYLGYATRIVFK